MITLKEFFDSNERLAIHCDTEEKANKLLKEFDKLGKKWSNELSYINNNNWVFYEKDTCYSNRYKFADYEFYKHNRCEVYEFEYIDFEEETIKELKEQIKELQRKLNKKIKEKKGKVWQFTDDEKVILRNVSKEFKYIARDEDNYLFIYTEKPYRNVVTWTIDCGDYISFTEFKHIFKDIKWEDDEPCEFRKYI